MKTFCLITNISGYKYWSYRYNSTKGNGLYAAMVRKYGTIYINNAGGWFAHDSVVTIHKIVKQTEFPVDI